MIFCLIMICQSNTMLSIMSPLSTPEEQAPSSPLSTPEEPALCSPEFLVQKSTVSPTVATTERSQRRLIELRWRPRRFGSRTCHQ
uniref:Uncharacterized protein n=1 Tax=Aegilops tauschii subsp. strangulata TaxID=200361 RepID=A0A453JYF3_AEGTS